MGIPADPAIDEIYNLKMLASLLQRVIFRFFTTYVDNFKDTRLKIGGIWKGDINLENISFREKVLSDLGIPVFVKTGIVGSLNIHIPWSRLLKEPIIISVTDLKLVLTPDDSSPSKQMRLRRAELFGEVVPPLSFNNNNNHSDDDIASNPSLRQRLLSQLTHSISITASNLHIRYLDQIVYPSTIMETNDQTWISFDVFINNLSSKTINAKNEKKICTSIQKLSGHQNIINNFYDDYQPDNTTQVIEPMCTTLIFTPNNDNGDLNLNITIDRISFSISSFQYHTLIHYLNYRISRFTKLEVARKWESIRRRRPLRGPKEAPRVWWRYAIYYIFNIPEIFSQLHLPNSIELYRNTNTCTYKYSWRDLHNFIFQRRRYIDLYKQSMIDNDSWLPELTTSERSQLLQLEDSLTADNIILFRQLSLPVNNNENNSKHTNTLISIQIDSFSLLLKDICYIRLFNIQLLLKSKMEDIECTIENAQLYDSNPSTSQPIITPISHYSIMNQIPHISISYKEINLQKKPSYHIDIKMQPISILATDIFQIAKNLSDFFSESSFNYLYTENDNIKSYQHMIAESLFSSLINNTSILTLPISFSCPEIQILLCDNYSENIRMNITNINSQISSISSSSSFLLHSLMFYDNNVWLPCLEYLLFKVEANLVSNSLSIILLGDNPPNNGDLSGIPTINVRSSFFSSISRIIEKYTIDSTLNSHSVSKSQDQRLSWAQILLTNQFLFELSIPSLAISLIDNNPQEITFIAIWNSLIYIDSGKEQVQLSFHIERIQIDNMLQSPQFPVVFSSNSSSNYFILLLCTISKNNPCHSKLIPSDITLQQVTINICDISFKIEENYLGSLIAYFYQILSFFPSGNNINEKNDDISLDIVVRHFEISSFTLTLTLSFSSGDTILSDTFHPIIKNVIQTLGLPLCHIDRVPLRLIGYQRTSTHLSLSSILSEILKHYTINLRSQALQGFAHHSLLLGNQHVLLDSVRTGLRDAIIEPAKGLVRQGGVGLAPGLIRGTFSLVKNTLFGVANSVAGVSHSAGSGLAACSLDPDFLNEHARSHIDGKPVTLLEGVVNAGECLSRGLFDGLSGFIGNPVKGLARGGASGLIHGTALGVLGIAVKPLTAVLDATSSFSEGLKSQMNIFDLDQERFNEKQVRPYNTTLYNTNFLIHVVKRPNIDYNKLSSSPLKLYHSTISIMPCISPSKTPQTVLLSSSRSPLLCQVCYHLRFRNSDNLCFSLSIVSKPSGFAFRVKNFQQNQNDDEITNSILFLSWDRSICRATLTDDCILRVEPSEISSESHSNVEHFMRFIDWNHSYCTARLSQ